MAVLLPSQQRAPPSREGQMTTTTTTDVTLNEMLYLRMHAAQERLAESEAAVRRARIKVELAAEQDNRDGGTHVEGARAVLAMHERAMTAAQAEMDKVHDV